MPTNPLDYHTPETTELATGPIRFWGVGLFISILIFLVSFPAAFVLRYFALEPYQGLLGTYLVWVAWIVSSICALKYLIASRDSGDRSAICGIPFRIIAYVVIGTWIVIALLLVVIVALSCVASMIF